MSPTRIRDSYRRTRNHLLLSSPRGGGICARKHQRRTMQLCVAEATPVSGAASTSPWSIEVRPMRAKSATTRSHTICTGASYGCHMNSGQKPEWTQLANSAAAQLSSPGRASAKAAVMQPDMVASWQCASPLTSPQTPQRLPSVAHDVDLPTASAVPISKRRCLEKRYVGRGLFAQPSIPPSVENWSMLTPSQPDIELSIACAVPFPGWSCCNRPSPCANPHMGKRRSRKRSFSDIRQTL